VVLGLVLYMGGGGVGVEGGARGVGMVGVCKP